MKLTPSEATKLQETLAMARLARASLSELGIAHDLATGAGLTETATELRRHVRRVVAEPTPNIAGSITGSLMLGVVSGIITKQLIG
jgi:hypothetical protein